MSYFLNKTLGKISAGLSSGNSSKDSAAHAAAAVASNNGNGGTNKAGSGNASGNNSSGFSSFFQRQSTVTYSNQFQQDAQLTLTHLRKIFYEYLHPKTGNELSPNERDEKLYSILPLFIKVNNRFL